MDNTVVIVGGGIVGSLLANMLTSLDISRVVLVEKNPISADKVQHDLRFSAMSPSSIDLLAKVNAWDDIADHNKSYYEQMYVWDAVTGSNINFSSRDYGKLSLGAIVKNNAVLYALFDACLSNNKIEVVQEECLGLHHDSDAIRLQLAHKELRANLVIAADGANSWVRREKNLATTIFNYDQMGIVANIRTKKSHLNVARQCFTNMGPLAFLPLPDANECSIVWSVDNKQGEKLLALSDDDFSRRLTNIFYKHSGIVDVISERLSFPLRLLHAKNYISDRIALVGDSAHVVHPLAGLGLNIGLHDVLLLHNVLKEALTSGHDIGSHRVLRSYERKARSHNIRFVYGIDAFNRGFRVANTFGVTCRKFFLELASNSTWLKRKFAFQAMYS